MVKLGYTAAKMDVDDLPAVPHHLRAMVLFRHMRKVYGKTQKRISVKRGSGWVVLGKVVKANGGMFCARKSTSRSPSSPPATLTDLPLCLQRSSSLC